MRACEVWLHVGRVSATVATQCSVLSQYYITAAVSSVVILNSSLSWPGPGSRQSAPLWACFYPISYRGTLATVGLLLVTVFCIPNGGSLNIRPVYHRPAPPGSGQYDLMSGSYFCQMVNILQDNYSKHNPLLPILTIFWVHVQVQFIDYLKIFTFHSLSLLTPCFSYKVWAHQAVCSAEQCTTHYKWIFTRNCDHLANSAVSPRSLLAVAISSARV